MLASVYLPFSDFRPLMVEGFSRLQRPTWPIPDPVVEHLRGLGSVRQRKKPGFEGWVGEDRLVIGASAFALALPYLDKDLGRIRLIRKACFFDGLLNGRLELLFTFDSAATQKATVTAAVQRLLNVAVKVTQCTFSGTILSSPEAVAHLWADATVAHGKELNVKWIRAGRPVCIVESDTFIDGYSNPRVSSSADAPDIDVVVLPTRKHTELITIFPPRADIIGRRHNFSRETSRTIRTYMFRLLQNTESLSLLLGLQLDAVEDDRVQNIFNEYTRQIGRSRQRLEAYSLPELVKYCYASFDRLYPGKSDAIRIRLQGSNIRPTVIKKILQFLDITEASNITVAGDFNMEKLMGDKYENINVPGQGVAIGRGAKAVVGDSANEQGASLSLALMAVAELVKSQADRPDAAIEAAVVEAAAKKAEEGDEGGAAALLKKSAGWVLDVAKAAGSAVLAAFLKSQLGIA